MVFGDSDLMRPTAELVSVLSLIIAGLAVFVGPVISLFIARRSLAIADKQRVTPIREAWLRELRTKLAQFSALALHYFTSGYNDRTDEEYRQLTLVQEEIVLLLNPQNGRHEQIVATVKAVSAALMSGNIQDDQRFIDAHIELTRKSQRLLQAEWSDLTAGAKA
jgi:hypothetical protein